MPLAQTIGTDLGNTGANFDDLLKRPSRQPTSPRRDRATPYL
jgi:hypothetical protein